MLRLRSNGTANPRTMPPKDDTPAILVVNAGSSSVKFALFDATGDAPRRLLRGQVEAIGTAPRLRIAAGDAPATTRALPAGTHAEAITAITALLREAASGWHVAAIGHRVVHGGADLAAPAIVDQSLRARLAALVPLAPLHQPHNLAGLDATTAAFPGVPQVACFDTAFHRGHPWEADVFALPRRFHAEGLRRYGFHGLSYESVLAQLVAEDPALARGRLVVAHLGAGASLCAIRDGQSLDSTMGFTALDGVPMATRSGAVDPGLVLHLLERPGMDAAALVRLLYHDSGLLGLSGISSDVRDLLASPAPEARAALSHFAWRVRREVGALVATLGGIDALIFTAGVGENAPPIRQMVCEGLGAFGLMIDPARNAAGAETISADSSPARILVRRTDEESVIARHTLALTGDRV
jgi:acetate kinase